MSGERISNIEKMSECPALLTTLVIPTTAGMQARAGTPAISKSMDPSGDTRNSRYTNNRKTQEPPMEVRTFVTAGSTAAAQKLQGCWQHQ